MVKLIVLATAGALILGSVTVVTGAHGTRSVDLGSACDYGATEIPIITNAI